MGLFKGVIDGMKEFGKSVANIMNAIFLLVLYIAGIGLTSICGKILGKRFLNLKPDRNRKSFYEDYTLKKEPLENYYRQF